MKEALISSNPQICLCTDLVSGLRYDAIVLGFAHDDYVGLAYRKNIRVHQTKTTNIIINFYTKVHTHTHTREES